LGVFLEFVLSATSVGLQPLCLLTISVRSKPSFAPHLPTYLRDRVGNFAVSRLAARHFACLIANANCTTTALVGLPSLQKNQPAAVKDTRYNYTRFVIVVILKLVLGYAELDPEQGESSI
jgi:hypothetical protein